MHLTDDEIAQAWAQWNRHQQIKEQERHDRLNAMEAQRQIRLREEAARREIERHERMARQREERIAREAERQIPSLHKASPVHTQGDRPGRAQEPRRQRGKSGKARYKSPLSEHGFVPSSSPCVDMESGYGAGVDVSVYSAEDVARVARETLAGGEGGGTESTHPPSDSASSALWVGVPATSLLSTHETRARSALRARAKSVWGKKGKGKKGKKGGKGESHTEAEAEAGVTISQPKDEEPAVLFTEQQGGEGEGEKKEGVEESK
ncbi:hypothetical protein KIPB_000311 [Kipferlia bialata]|uniref:Uncharacterized protein n=1 Tax=Kipferlia bialata TaxID=797122 RepID=A0A9K3CNV8_9EUKA|nr:hypothetical protein KIPB_000311 [Kipferlia bialata]|eukprot:g311.t1